MTTAELYDHLQEMFGIGDWTESSGVPWYRARMTEIGKLKRTLKSRKISEEDLYQAALYAQANDIAIPATWRLFELIGVARAVRATGAKTDRLQNAIDEAWKNNDPTWAMHLDGVHRNDPAAVEQALKEYSQAKAAQVGAEREASIVRVDGAAPEDWKQEAAKAVNDLAQQGKEFTTDDVWDALERRGVPAPPESRALGPIMRRAFKAEVVQVVGYDTSRLRPGSVVRTYIGVTHD